MSKRKQTDIARDDSSYVAKKPKKFNIFAFILCVLIAFIIWIYASSVEEKNKELLENSSTTHAAIVSSSATVRSL
jgi:YbbR domain-containing protein